MTRLINTSLRLFLGLTALFSAVAAEPAAPRLVCEEPEHDFGLIRDTQAVTHVFSLLNAGDAPLIITRVRPTCGCTTVDFTATNLAPGRSAGLHVRFDAGNRHGSQHKAIYLESNDPLEPRYKLAIKGTIVNDVAVLPPAVHFGVLSSSSGWVEQQVAVEYTPPPAVRVTGVTVDSPLFVVRLNPTNQANRYEIFIGTRGGQTHGNIQAMMTIATDHPRYPAIQVPVYAYAQPDLAALPASLGLSAHRVTNRVTVTIYSRSQKPFLIRGIDSPDSNLTVRVAPVSTSRYELQIQPPVDTINLNGKSLRVQTDMDSAAEVLIPIRVLMAAPSGVRAGHVPAAAGQGGPR